MHICGIYTENCFAMLCWWPRYLPEITVIGAVLCEDDFKKSSVWALRSVKKQFFCLYFFCFNEPDSSLFLCYDLYCQDNMTFRRLWDLIFLECVSIDCKNGKLNSFWNQSVRMSKWLKKIGKCIRILCIYNLSLHRDHDFLLNK